MTSAARLRCPRCRRHHKGWFDLADCCLGDVRLVGGAGYWACVNRCPPRGGHVQLYHHRREAERDKRDLDYEPCCYRCTGAHTVVNLADCRT